MVEQANDKFSATMTNVVQWREAEQSNSSSNGSSAGSHHGVAGPVAKEICSDTSIQVVLEVPGWFVIPTGMIEKTGGTLLPPQLGKLGFVFVSLHVSATGPGAGLRQGPDCFVPGGMIIRSGPQI